MDPRQRLQLVSALAHVAPGVTVELTGHNHQRLIVAAHRLDAAMTPCQLRAAVIAAQPTGAPSILDAVSAVEIVGGVQHLGGGVYQRCAALGDERWFVTLLGADRVGEIFDACEMELPSDATHISIGHDPGLGVTAVRIICDDPAHAARLDELACWAVGACMVEELIGQVAEQSQR